MKKYLLLIFFVSQFLHVVKSAELGEIKTNVNYAITLHFDMPVVHVIFGNNPMIGTDPNGIPVFKYYDLLKTDKNVVIKAKNNHIPEEMSITIILDQEIVYTGILKYCEKIEKQYHEYKTKVNSFNETEKTLGKKILSCEERLEDVLNSKDKYKRFAAVKNKMIFRVGYIKNDTENTYIKITIENNSASIYELKGISFKYVEGKKRLFRKKDLENEEDKMPVCEILSKNKSIRAYDKEIIGYSIPLFSTNKTGSLIIKFVEKDGYRNEEIIIEAKDLAEIDVF